MLDLKLAIISVPVPTVLEDYATQPAPRSRVTSLAGSVVIHLAVLIVVFQFRSSIEAHLNRYNATTLYVPPVESAPAAVPKMRQTSVLPIAPPPVLRPPALFAKLPPPKPALELPAPPELLVTRNAPLPAPHPLLPAPAPAPPVPASPVFASAAACLPRQRRILWFHGRDRLAPFHAAAAPTTAKLQIVGDTFSTVPADTPRHGSPTGAVLPAGFGAAGVAAPSPRRSVPGRDLRRTSVELLPRLLQQEPAPPAQATAPAFTSAVAADPVRQPAAKRQPVAEPLEILFKPRPDYTEEARRARLEGDVVLEVLFTSSGNLRVLRVVRGLGRGLDQNAIDAAGKIRFRAATEDGRAVDTVAVDPKSLFK